MPHTIYLTSYDRYSEVLEYNLPSGTFTVHKRDEWERRGLTLTFGAFCSERVRLAEAVPPKQPEAVKEHVLGVFASPEGPVLFMDARHIIGRFGHTTARVDDIVPAQKKNMKIFSLTHRAVDGKTTDFILIYEQRIGLGANPYDNEEEDIDLLALIAASIGHEAFFRLYTKEWVAG
jgi:hypothetical protein